MASLTDTLATERTGLPTAEPVRRGPNFLESIMAGAQTVIGAVEGAADTNRKRDQLARQQAEDAKKEAERQATNAAARGSVFAALGPDEDPAVKAAQAAQGAVGEIAAIHESASQGRGQGTFAVEARSEAVIRTLMRQFPGQEAVVLDTLRQNGVWSAATSEYARASKSLEDEQSAEAKREQGMIDFGMKLGFDPASWDDPAQARLNRKAVIQYMAGEEALARIEREGTIAERKARMTREEYEFEQKNISTEMLQIGMNEAGSLMVPIQKAIGDIINDPSIPDAEKDTRLRQVLGNVQTTASIVKKNFLAKNLQYMTPETRAEYERYIDTSVEELSEMFTGPASLVARNKAQLDILTTRLNIDVQKALPVWSQLKASLGSSQAVDGFLNTVLNDPELGKSIQRELSGLSQQGLRRGEGAVRVNNLLSLYAGEREIQDFTPEEARRMAPQNLKMMINLTNNRDIQSGRDEAGHARALTSIGAVTNVAIEAVPQWQAGPLADLGIAMTQPGVIKTLFTQSGDPEARARTVGAYMPALKNTYDSLSKAPMGDASHEVVWNPRKQGGAGWDIRAKPGVRQTASLPDQFGGVRVVRNEPSAVLVKQRNSLNAMLSTMTNAARNGHDQSLPGGGTKLNDNERRLYYGQNVVPQVLREERRNQRQRSASQFENLDNLVTQSLNAVGNIEFTPGEAGDPVEDAASYIAGPEGTGNNPRSSATGTGQFLEATWLDMIKRYEPQLAEGKTKEQILALRSDPAIGRRQINNYAKDNAQKLQAAGLPVNRGTVYLSHFAGPEGAIKLLRADPNLDVAQVLGRAVVTANPHLRGKTVAQTIDWARKFISA